MKLEYNSPLILTFTLIATAVMIIDTIFSGFTGSFFAFPGAFNFSAPLDYFRLFSYTAGHANWPHLVGNFSIILLIGPILEEKYGSADLLFMMAITALVSSTLSILLFDNGLEGTREFSRAIELAIDPEEGTAELVWEFVPDPPIAA